MLASFPNLRNCDWNRGRDARQCRLRQALEDGFGVQYWGATFTVDDLEKAGHGLLIVEATRLGAPFSADGVEELFSPEDVRRISRDGQRPVIAYLNVAEIEYYRDYWVRHVGKLATADSVFSASWIGPQTESGEQLAVYWDPTWERILQARVARLMSLGFDGILFDDALHYFSFHAGKGLHWAGAAAETPAEGHAMALMSLVLRLTRGMREAHPSAIAIVNNGVFVARDAAAVMGLEAVGPVFERYAASLDGILIESLFAPGAAEAARGAALEDFASRGVSVLTIDYLSDFPDTPVTLARATLNRRAGEIGFCAYVVPDGKFDRLSPPLRCQDYR